ncbi:MAG: ATP-binding cassette domain-containing protein, partial [Acidobacteriota bacterium]|nr:ATP-binding cassette domain-containing protein [Acidobacteriota bacterium]
MTPSPRPAPPADMANPAPVEPLIAFSDVHLGFDEGDVLHGINFEVWPGETKVLLGETGTGKTLIMKLGAGLLRADSGRIWVMGHELGEMSEQELLEFRRHLGFVFQEGALFDSITVADNVGFRLQEENLSDAELESRVREVLRFVELESSYDMYPGDLSGGMRRRVSIARALADRPPVVFYDSPTAGLDPVTSQTIITLIMRGRDLQNVTSMIATHRVQDAFGLANYRFDPGSGRVVHANGASSAGSQREGHADASRGTNVLVLREGRIYFEGAAEELLRTSDEYLKKFL